MPDETEFRPHLSSLVPIYHWYGSRPGLLDLDDDQTGWLICLLLERAGDRCLLPVAWLQEPSLRDDDRFLPAALAGHPRQPATQADALDNPTLAMALAGLRRDGWQVNGRLELHFHGRHSQPGFWNTLQPYLRQENPPPAAGNES